MPIQIVATVFFISDLRMSLYVIKLLYAGHDICCSNSYLTQCLASVLQTSSTLASSMNGLSKPASDIKTNHSLMACIHLLSPDTNNNAIK